MILNHHQAGDRPVVWSCTKIMFVNGVWSKMPHANQPNNVMHFDFDATVFDGCMLLMCSKRLCGRLLHTVCWVNKFILGRIIGCSRKCNTKQRHSANIRALSLFFHIILPQFASTAAYWSSRHRLANIFHFYWSVWLWGLTNERIFFTRFNYAVKYRFAEKSIVVFFFVNWFYSRFLAEIIQKSCLVRSTASTE